MVNSEPSPSLLATFMVPPMILTILAVIAIPRPVPCILSIIELFSLEKLSKIWGRNSSFIPIPVSLTEKTYFERFLSGRLSSEPVTNISFPSGVYFIALLIIFIRTWLNLNSSITTPICFIFEISKYIFSFFFSA